MVLCLNLVLIWWFLNKKSFMLYTWIDLIRVIAAKVLSEWLEARHPGRIITRPLSATKRWDNDCKVPCTADGRTVEMIKTRLLLERQDNHRYVATLRNISCMIAFWILLDDCCSICVVGFVAIKSGIPAYGAMIQIHRLSMINHSHL